MYFNYLTDDNAQTIADAIMKIIPYNINIMNNEGIIIASGDKSRINTIHKGSLKAIELKESYKVYKNTETEYKGINIPIFFKKNIVGVIGISGDVDEVTRIGEIVAVTARLMIENQIMNEMAFIKESRLKDFLYDWVNLKKEDYTDEFLERALLFNIDVFKLKTAVIFTSVKSNVLDNIIEKIKNRLEKDEYIVRQREKEILVLFNSYKNLDKKIQDILNESNKQLKCFIGISGRIVSETVESVIQANKISKVLDIENEIVRFEEIELEWMLAGVDSKSEIKDIIEQLQEKDIDYVLTQTIFVYANNSNNQTEICNKLHIHRNTLSYRLGKIEEITGKNPRCAKELMILYTAAIKIKLSKV